MLKKQASTNSVVGLAVVTLVTRTVSTSKLQIASDCNRESAISRLRECPPLLILWIPYPSVLCVDLVVIHTEVPQG